MRDAAETGLGVFFGVVLAASLTAYVLIKHPRAQAARAPDPLPPPPPAPPVAPGPGSAAPPIPIVPAPSSGPIRNPYNAASWAPVFAQVAPDLPLPYLLKWAAVESDFNPCAEGHEGQLGETGLMQLMYPDNIRDAQTTIPAMRVGCYGNTSMLARPLTPDEMVAHAIPNVTYIRKCRDRARGNLAAVGLRWDERSPDFWSMVKLEHAGPALASDGLAYVAAHYGAPQTWAEFRHDVLAESTLQAVPSLARVRNNPLTANNLHAAIANAEKTGAAVAAPPRPAA